MLKVKIKVYEKIREILNNLSAKVLKAFLEKWGYKKVFFSFSQIYLFNISTHKSWDVTRIYKFSVFNIT